MTARKKNTVVVGSLVSVIVLFFSVFVWADKKKEIHDTKDANQREATTKNTEARAYYDKMWENSQEVISRITEHLDKIDERSVKNETRIGIYHKP